MWSWESENEKEKISIMNFWNVGWPIQRRQLSTTIKQKAPICTRFDKGGHEPNIRWTREPLTSVYPAISTTRLDDRPDATGYIHSELYRLQLSLYHTSVWVRNSSKSHSSLAAIQDSRSARLVPTSGPKMVQSVRFTNVGIMSTNNEWTILFNHSCSKQVVLQKISFLE